MSTGAYSFLPWLRAGIATKISDPPVAPSTRATIPVKLVVAGDPVEGTGRLERPVEQPVQLYGPGDVVGVDPRAISRTEPRPWITNVEPNYLAHIEFYEEDYLWRYSPAVPDASGTLSPWLALIVLEGPDAAGKPVEFTEGVLPDRPLPFITVADPAKTLPNPDQLGAWAHVHVNGELDDAVVSDTGRMTSALAALRAVLDADPDNACSRLLCPRHLKANTPYHAFLVPAFETGRLAGLGLDPLLAKDQGAVFPAWGRTYQDQKLVGQLPYYHRWFFGTGDAGDFEHLVRQLKPDRPDVRVARRDIDVSQRPGAGLPPITEPQSIGGVLKLGGALKVPDRPLDQWDDWDGRRPTVPPAAPAAYPHPFQEALAGLINLADDYLDSAPAEAHARLTAAPGHTDFAVVPGAPEVRVLADEVDPVITPPLYGKWHALTSRLLTERDGTTIPAPRNRNWVHRLNLDPRFRVAANFGTQVVQARQEEFMAAAWAQIGDVLEANKRIRAAQLAREVGYALQRKHLDRAPAPTTRQGLAAPAPSRSARALRLTAPAGSRVNPSPSASRTAGAHAAADGGSGDENLALGYQVAASRIGAAPVSPEMRRITRPGSRLMRTLDFAEQSPDELLPKMDRDEDAVTAAPAKVTPEAVVTSQELDSILHPVPPPPPAVEAESEAAAEADPEEITRLRTSARFVISLPAQGIVPPTGGDDSAEAKRFKTGLRDLYRARADAEVGARRESRDALDVAGAAQQMLTGLEADATVPRDLLTSVRVPARLQAFADRFLEAMAYPVIDLAMFQSLVDMSVETFVPGLHLVPPNTITLLETDQEFIEAFMVGLNHEMARELLWREYPTDQRCTTFRQFWDPRPALSLPGETAEQRKERLYDITRIAGWTPDSVLGGHDNRDLAGQEEELVLVIRGDLLKKYPTAAIYAHRADWDRDEDGTPRPERERVLAEFPDSEHPPPDMVKLPIYEAKVEPDITLLGFDLTATEARGRLPDRPGWFFVIKERPGDPRFGVDEEGQGTDVVEVWNDLSWQDVDPEDTRFIALDPDVQVPLAPFDGSEDDQEKEEQRREDVFLPRWDQTLSSADIAYMLFQAPVLIAVHAHEMLLEPESPDAPQ
ncbi:hypothetical protein [Streptomyces phaeochromogenes]|uniref:hypothetical protein n=1 Tax=Streptomyces phaeochromogenes TaxID=1923 RepID=UPI0037194F5F